MHSCYLLPYSTTRGNVIIFGANINWSVHINNKGKDILILGDGPIQGLDDTTLTAEAIYSINLHNQIENFG